MASDRSIGRRLWIIFIVFASLMTFIVLLVTSEPTSPPYQDPPEDVKSP